MLLKGQTQTQSSPGHRFCPPKEKLQISFFQKNVLVSLVQSFITAPAFQMYVIGNVCKYQQEKFLGIFSRSFTKQYKLERSFKNTINEYKIQKAKMCRSLNCCVTQPLPLAFRAIRGSESKAPNCPSCKWLWRRGREAT